MKSNESAEMYLESILILKRKQGTVHSIDVARETGYSKPSVSRAMGLLRQRGMITIDPDGVIRLTGSGMELASKILERHETLTEVLVSLGVPPDRAQEDACRIEHVISDESMACIRAAIRKKDGPDPE